MIGITFRSALALVAGAALLAACSSSTDPADAETCGEVVDMAVVLTQEFIDALEASDATVDEFLSPSDSPLTGDEQQQFLEGSDALEDRWSDLDCPGEIAGALALRSDDLDYSKRIGEYVIEQLRAVSE